MGITPRILTSPTLRDFKMRFYNKKEGNECGTIYDLYKDKMTTRVCIYARISEEM